MYYSVYSSFTTDTRFPCERNKVWNANHMKSIQALSEEEQKHYIQCGCGEYLNMRDLREVINHQHLTEPPEASYDYSIKVGEPIAYTTNGQKIKLN